MFKKEQSIAFNQNKQKIVYNDYAHTVCIALIYDCNWKIKLKQVELK